MAEQRYLAVLAVIAEGHPVSSVAEQWRVSGQTVHSWLGRCAAAGLEGLADRSRCPASGPHQMPAAVQAAVLEMRQCLRRARRLGHPRVHGRHRSDQSRHRRSPRLPLPGRHRPARGRRARGADRHRTTSGHRDLHPRRCHARCGLNQIRSAQGRSNDRNDTTPQTVSTSGCKPRAEGAPC